ncbi:uncharacterized protein LOC100909253 [Galendromus occidentalis]|uniref:Uncharacterized protein LOC100909253 n=1 Tax=Galendromus occidentalis TaxID=34638 RepID=A0AAJ7P904_9ACAR|nr:uncharacterized protein LOC100909253 [Galendromus occidentalis]
MRVEVGSVDERSSSGANSVTSDDSSERTAKKSEVPRNAALRYSYEFLLKLQKSKLSKKPPECIDRLRQECILRETWRSDREKDSERDTEFPAALTKPPPSFRGGCKVDKAVLSDNPNPGSNSVKKSAASKGERRVGSGRLGSYNKDRESDYGYPQERSRRLFDHQVNEPLKRSNGRYVDMNSSRGHADDEPEWFTEGPTSQTDTIELGGFEDKSRKVRTPSPPEKPTFNVDGQRSQEFVNLLKEMCDIPSGTRKNASINFEQSFGNGHDDEEHSFEDEAIQAASRAGSRFMSKVFAKTVEDDSSPSSKPASPPINAKDLETSPRPVLELLENTKESTSVSSLLKDMFPSSGESHRSESVAISSSGTASNYDSPEGLQSRNSLQNGNMLGSIFPTPVTMGSSTTAPKLSAPKNGVLDVEKGVQGKNILELLLSGANVTNVPSTPHSAKSVEELEADLKMESRLMQMTYPAGPSYDPFLDGRSMMAQLMGNGAMERSLGLLSDLQSSVRDIGQDGAIHPGAPYMSSNSSASPPQQVSASQIPAQQAYQHTQQRQQQANTTHNNASLDIMRLLMEGSSMPERDQGKPYKQQDLRNVPTSVLLQEKHAQRGKSGPQAGGPRPIVKSNKNPPPCPPPTAPAETGEDLLQRLFHQQQHEQQFAHHQYQHQQHPQQQYHHHPSQQAHHQQQQQRFRSYMAGPQGAVGFNGNTTAPAQHQVRMAPSQRRPLTGGHGQRFPQGGAFTLGSGPISNHAANVMARSSESSILSPDDALAKWFGNLGCNQPSLPVPTNVLRVEELERQNNRLHQAKPTA